MTHGQLLACISSRELSEWLALYSIEMLPQQRLELLLAQLLALTANVHRNEGDPAADPADFLPWWNLAWDPAAEMDEPGQTPAQMLALVEQLNAALGGEDRRGRPEVVNDD